MPKQLKLHRRFFAPLRDLPPSDKLEILDALINLFDDDPVPTYIYQKYPALNQYFHEVLEVNRKDAERRQKVKENVYKWRKKQKEINLKPRTIGHSIRQPIQLYPLPRIDEDEDVLVEEPIKIVKEPERVEEEPKPDEDEDVLSLEPVQIESKQPVFVIEPEPPSPKPAKKKKKASKAKSKPRTFIKPTIEECQKYAIEKGMPIEIGEKFWFHYESNGWKVGKNPMKNWHVALGGTWYHNWMDEEKNQRKQYESQRKPESNHKGGF